MWQMNTVKVEFVASCLQVCYVVSQGLQQQISSFPCGAVPVNLQNGASGTSFCSFSVLPLLPLSFLLFSFLLFSFLPLFLFPQQLVWNFCVAVQIRSFNGFLFPSARSTYPIPAWALRVCSHASLYAQLCFLIFRGKEKVTSHLH